MPLPTDRSTSSREYADAQYLVAEVQRLRDRNETLEARVTDLQASVRREHRSMVESENSALRAIGALHRAECKVTELETRLASIHEAALAEPTEST